MNESEQTSAKKKDIYVSEIRSRWLAASERASRIADELFKPGSGYGDPDAQRQDEHRLQSSRNEAERLFSNIKTLIGVG